MPARKRPTSEDAGTARQVLLDGLARDAEVLELVSELAPLHPRDNTFPGEVFLRLAADALDWCGASRADPLPLEGLRERFLPERAFRGRQNSKFQYAVLAAAALHGGTEPDLLEEVGWWQADDFWQYALFAAVAYVRAAAGRAGVPVRQAKPGKSYSSNCTPHCLSSRTSVSASATMKPIWVCEPDAAPLLGNSIDRSLIMYADSGRGKGVLSLFAAENGGGPMLELRIEQICSMPPYDSQVGRPILTGKLR